MARKLPWKLPAATALIFSFSVSAVCGGMLFRSARRRRRFQIANMQFHARMLMRALGIGLQAPPVDGGPEGQLVVANHVSYLDAVILAARYRAVFVTSVEVRDTPFLGMISKLAGCAFVERRNRTGVGREAEALARLLGDGINVVMFPEGTSTDGSRVLPFKRSLFRSALAARAAVRPVTLNYRKVDGIPVSAANRDRIFYYGDLLFGPQFLELLSTRSIEVELKEPGDISPPADHRQLAEQAFNAVTRGFQPVT